MILGMKHTLAGKRDGETCICRLIWKYFNIRAEERQCILVLIGVTENGEKELLALAAGYRESALSWKPLLLSLKQRGLAIAPELAIGDGALGFWNALAQVYPETRKQRCWVHKTANILDKLPKKQQTAAKEGIWQIYRAATKADALQAQGYFILKMRLSVSKPYLQHRSA